MLIARLARMSARGQAMCTGIVLLLCGYLSYAGIVKPQLLELRAVRAKLKAQQALLLARHLAGAQRVVEEAKRDSLRQRLARSDAQFPSLSQASDLLASLAEVARLAGCRVVAVDVLPRQKPIETPQRRAMAQLPARSAKKEGPAAGEGTQRTRRPVKVGVRLSVAGMYSDIIKLLQATGACSQTAYVEGLTLALVSEDASQLNASFVLIIPALEAKGDKQP